MPSITAYERQLKAAQREADIDRVATLERELVCLHRESFRKAERKVLPPPETVDPAPIEAELEREMHVPDLVANSGGGEVPPVAPPPGPVDRYELMREFRKARRQGIPFWHLREQIDAARQADHSDRGVVRRADAGRELKAFPIIERVSKDTGNEKGHGLGRVHRRAEFQRLI